MRKIEILGLSTIPDIRAGDKLGEIIVHCAEDEVGGIQGKDIVVITSKIVSKAEDNLAVLGQVKPGKKALSLAKRTGKAAEKIQLIFDSGQEIVAVLPLKELGEKYIMKSTRRPAQARRLLEEEACILVTKDKEGRLHTYDGGIDSSNHPSDTVSLLPPDPDGSARRLRYEIKGLIDKEVAVLIADTEVVPFGSIDLAIGASGIETVAKKFGEDDRFGRPKFGGMDVTAYELTAAAALLFGQTSEGIPVAIIRGLDYQISEEENVLNTLVADWHEMRKVVGSAIKATASIGGLKARILYWILHHFMRI